MSDQVSQSPPVPRTAGFIRIRIPSPGIGAALLAALLFGASTPFAKLLTGNLPPVLLAGLLYLGSGMGLGAILLIRNRGVPHLNLSRHDLLWLAGAIILGGILGPVLLMIGLVNTEASSASLLLNFESVFTALLAWFVFRENVDKRIAVGFVLIVCGGVLLSWVPGGGFSLSVGLLAVLGACLCWGFDNNFTQKISAADPLQIASLKGLVAGVFNVALAIVSGVTIPGLPVVGGALVVGLVGYGASLALFVFALRHLGTARTSAYFSVAPFAGAALSLLLLGESLAPLFALAGILMGIGVWIHMTEHHSHAHEHTRLVHSHAHVHDDHHQHDHEKSEVVQEPHHHLHEHEPMIHRHPHYPDIHHRHHH